MALSLDLQRMVKTGEAMLRVYLGSPLHDEDGDRERANATCKLHSLFQAFQASYQSDLWNKSLVINPTST